MEKQGPATFVDREPAASEPIVERDPAITTRAPVVSRSRKR